MVFVNASRPNGDFVAASFDTIEEGMIEAAYMVSQEGWPSVTVRSGFDFDDFEVKVSA